MGQCCPAPAIVGQGYIGQVKTRGDRIDFEYDQTGTHSQTSTLGVGISAHGVSVEYTGDGTNTSTATGSEGFPTQTRNSLFVADFSVGGIPCRVLWLRRREGSA